MTPPALVRVADAGDAPALAQLRTAWTGDPGAEEPAFAQRLAAWLAAEGDRRTSFLALVDGEPAGMASLFEYRRMPQPGRADSCWGYVSNMFVRDDLRGRGIGAQLLDALLATAEERDYARVVLSPSDEAVGFYRRAGFVPAGDAGPDALLVRPGGAPGPFFGYPN